MEKKIRLLVKRVKYFTNINNKLAASFLLNVFSENDVFSLPQKKQKVIINNLLSYFDTIVCGIETYKKKNHLISENDILNHLDTKVSDLVITCKHLKIY